tara:strand:- start:27 stop:215 length:189 start_codon:yes stop_codon:yes gene_type:complete
MIDAKKRYQELVNENTRLKDTLEKSQRELADSVLAEIQLREEVTKLSKEVRRLAKLATNKTS